MSASHSPGRWWVAGGQVADQRSGSASSGSSGQGTRLGPSGGGGPPRASAISSCASSALACSTTSPVPSQRQSRAWASVRPAHRRFGHSTSTTSAIAGPFLVDAHEGHGEVAVDRGGHLVDVAAVFAPAPADGLTGPRQPQAPADETCRAQRPNPELVGRRRQVVADCLADGHPCAQALAALLVGEAVPGPQLAGQQFDLAANLGL